MDDFEDGLKIIKTINLIFSSLKETSKIKKTIEKLNKLFCNINKKYFFESLLIQIATMFRSIPNKIRKKIVEVTKTHKKKICACNGKILLSRFSFSYEETDPRLRADFINLLACTSIKEVDVLYFLSLSLESKNEEEKKAALYAIEEYCTKTEEVPLMFIEFLIGVYSTNNIRWFKIRLLSLVCFLSKNSIEENKIFVFLCKEFEQESEKYSINILDCFLYLSLNENMKMKIIQFLFKSIKNKERSLLVQRKIMFIFRIIAETDLFDSEKKDSIKKDMGLFFV